jgi:hypothetical protein
MKYAKAIDYLSSGMVFALQDFLHYFSAFTPIDSYVGDKPCVLSTFIFFFLRSAAWVGGDISNTNEI